MTHLLFCCEPMLLNHKPLFSPLPQVGKGKYQQSLTVSAGFTLLEVLLALLIFAMLSLTAYQVLHASLRNDEVMSSKSAELSALQYAMGLIEQDLRQVVLRPVSGNMRLPGDFLSVSSAQGTGQETDGNDNLLMVRANWFNPADLLPRSQLLRCGYRVQKGELQRVTYPQVDMLDDPTPPSRTLLRNVRRFELNFLYQGKWLHGWMLPTALPDAVQITLDAGQIGQIQRIILLTNGYAR